MYRLAAVSFLNTVPLIEWFRGPGRSLVDLTVALPSRLGPLLTGGKADAALLPAIEVLDGVGGGMIGATGIACGGAVGSVQVFTRGDLSRLREVAVDRGSRSSVALLRILLLEIYGIRPEFREVEPDTEKLPDDRSAVLVIGDRCFEFQRALAGNPEGIRGHDLGSLWWELTGLPFVFASWVVGRDFAKARKPSEIEALGCLITEARDFGLASIPGLAAREAAAGRLGRNGEATAEALNYYFSQSLRYTLGAEELDGLKTFRQLCDKHRLLEASVPPVVL